MPIRNEVIESQVIGLGERGTFRIELDSHPVGGAGTSSSIKYVALTLLPLGTLFFAFSVSNSNYEPQH
jgi:hypothetical protein